MQQSPCERNPTDTAAGECDEREGAYPWVMAATILGSSIAFLDGSIVSVALPAVRAGLGLNLDQIQWTINGYTLVLAAFILPAGSAGDIFGRRRVFMLGVAIFTITSLWSGLARSGTELILARLVQGAGAALMVPASLALITANVPKARRGRAIGIWAAASAASTSFGPLLGGLVIDVLGWRPALMMTAPLGLATLWITWRGVPESELEEGHMDWLGGALACLGLGGVAYWLTSVASGAGGLAYAAGVLGAALLAAFLWHQNRTAEPMMPLHLFRERLFAVANLQTFLLYAALYGNLTYLPVVLIDAHGYDATSAGLAMLPFAMTIAILSRSAGGLMDRLGPKPLLVAGPAIAAIGLAGLIWVARSGDYFASVLPVMLILGLGMGLTVTPLSATVMNAVDDNHAGTASGINNATSRVAGLIGVPLFALLGQIGFIQVAPGTFGEPGTVDDNYRAAMASGLAWIGAAAGMLAAASALVAAAALPGQGGAEPAAAT